MDSDKDTYAEKLMALAAEVIYEKGEVPPFWDQESFDAFMASDVKFVL